MSQAEIAATLRRIEQILEAAREVRWCHTIRSMRRWVEGGEDLSGREVALEILKLFQGGMGSFNDFALQNREGILPEQAEFSELQSLLFEQARDLL